MKMNIKPAEMITDSNGNMCFVAEYQNTIVNKKRFAIFLGERIYAAVSRDEALEIIKEQFTAQSRLKDLNLRNCSDLFKENFK